MDYKRSGGIVAAVSLTIMAAFVAITLLVIHTSVDYATQYAENLSDLYASELLSQLRELEHNKPLTRNVTSRDLENAIRVFWEGEAPGTALFSEDGTVISSTASKAPAGTNVLDVYPEIAPAVEDVQKNGQLRAQLWKGLDGLLPQGQVLYGVRKSNERNVYLLTVFRAESIFSVMRARVTTLVLVFSVVMILLLLMVMFIVRWYRTRLMRAATTDELTGLANRKWFSASFNALSEEDLAKAHLALIDVDKFKHVNDTYGHAAGDDALAAVADEVRKMVGTDGLASRWGGDEFIALLCVEEAEAHKRAQEMIDAVAVREIGEDIHVTVSMGMARMYTGETLEEVLERADDALYVTKEGGRGFLTVYQEGVTPHMSETVAVESPVASPRVVANRNDAVASETPVRRTKLMDSKSARMILDRIVRSLLTAVYKMVPFVAGGGILIALAILIDAASVNVNALDAEARASFGAITPIASGLHDVGAAAFNFMLPIFSAFFARELAGEEAFMAGFAGGFLSSQGSAGFAGAIASACVAAIVVNLMRGLFRDTSERLQRVAPVLIYPVFSLLIMYLLMTFVIDPVASAFDALLTSMLGALEAHGRVLLGAVCGAMMATDMGGPINKAAYHFGTAAIASGSPDVMAAVMVGGMVPPCGIALCMLLYGSKFNAEERDQGLATFVMGLSFITEGALPFVLADPLRVIASCMVGSAVAGGLSEYFGCTLLAPHGGVFVFPVVGNLAAYAGALAIGALVCALTLGLLKRQRK